ncbi:MAG: hypothetical protein ABIE68_03165 [bacterium]
MTKNKLSSGLRIGVIIIVIIILALAIYLRQKNSDQEEVTVTEPTGYNEDGSINYEMIAADVAQDEVGEDGLKTYQHDVHQFSVKYPDSWKKGEAEEPTDKTLEAGWEEIAMYIFDPQTVIAPDNLFSATTGVFVFKNKLSDLENIDNEEAWFVNVRNKYKDSPEAQYKDADEEIVAESKYNYPATSLHYESEELYRTVDEMWILRGQDVFFIHAFAPSNDYDRYQEKFADIIDSFTFK